jgi:hypothetical protein
MGDADALHTMRHNHPRFLDEKVKWLPKPLSDEEVLAAPLQLADAELALARAYDFADWTALERYVFSVGGGDPQVRRFEAAVKRSSAVTSKPSPRCCANIPISLPRDRTGSPSSIRPSITPPYCTI